MTVQDFLLRKTDVGELCVIRDCGWIVAVAYVDPEDLSTCAINPRLLNRPVLQDKWDKLMVKTKDGYDDSVAAHFIDC